VRSPSFACSIRSAPAAASACRRPCPQPPPTCMQPTTIIISHQQEPSWNRQGRRTHPSPAVPSVSVRLSSPMSCLRWSTSFSNMAVLSRVMDLSFRKKFSVEPQPTTQLATSATKSTGMEQRSFDGEGAVRCRTRSMNERRWRASRTLICRMMSLRQAGSGTGAPPEGGGERGADVAKLPLEVEGCEPHPHQARAGASPCSAEELLVEVTSCCISIDLARSRFQSKPINVQIAVYQFKRNRSRFSLDSDPRCKEDVLPSSSLLLRCSIKF